MTERISINAETWAQHYEKIANERDREASLIAETLEGVRLSPDKLQEHACRVCGLIGAASAYRTVARHLRETRDRVNASE